MTVEELIAKLRKHPLEANVKLEDWNEQYVEPAELDKVRLENGEVLLGVLSNNRD